MPERKTLSRRAAMAIAGTLTASAAAATALRGSAPDQTIVSAATDDTHRHIARLLQRVRDAHRSTDRAEAFDRCVAAFRLHERCEGSRESQPFAPQNGSARSLYRHADPSMMLAKVIVRELDALPTTDHAWMQRFGDLEAAFRGHVETIAEREQAS